MQRIAGGAISALALCLVACGGDDGGAGGDAGPDATPVNNASWAVVHQNLDRALMSIWGTSANDVWACGSDVGDGPLVIHWDGSGWTELDTGTVGDLWWVYGFAGGPVYFGGKGGRVLRYQDGAFTAMTTPGDATVFGIWGTSPSDLWAVGASDGGSGGGFVWRLEGETWVAPAGLPVDLADNVVWKVVGADSEDVWMVGGGCYAIHWDGLAFAESNLGCGESLFTVAYGGGVFTAVGGFATGLIYENDGTGWRSVGKSSDPALVGVALGPDGSGVAVGQYGAIMARRDGAWETVGDGINTTETLHAAWIDPTLGEWTVGGQVQVIPLVEGLLGYRGNKMPEGAIQ